MVWLTILRNFCSKLKAEWRTHLRSSNLNAKLTNGELLHKAAAVPALCLWCFCNSDFFFPIKQSCLQRARNNQGTGEERGEEKLLSEVRSMYKWDWAADNNNNNQLAQFCFFSLSRTRTRAKSRIELERETLYQMCQFSLMDNGWWWGIRLVPLFYQNRLS